MKNKRILHLKDLEQWKTYVLLEPQFKKQLFKTLIKYLNNKEVSNLLKVKRGTFNYWKGKGQKYTYKRKESFTKSYIPLSKIYSIIKCLRNKGHKKYTRSLIEKKIIAFKSKGGNPIKNPRFPINFETEEGAILVAALLCDGGISKDGYPLYNNSELCMRKRVVNAIKKLIGDINTNPSKPQKNNCLYFSKTIKDILVRGLDMKLGDKVTNNPKIPKLFLKTNKKEVISAFLNQAFSDDGSIYGSIKKTQRHLVYGESRAITGLNKKLLKEIKNKHLVRYSTNLVKDCKFLLEKLGIKVNGPYCKQEYIRKKYGKKEIIHSWGIYIHNRQSIQLFKSLIGFSIPWKNKRLDNILKSYKNIEQGTSLKDSLQKVIKLNNERKMINTINFMKERKCNLDYARFLLKELRKKRFIEIKNKGINLGRYKGCTPYEYELVKGRAS